jgi:uncharacterized RDD family membrane protein YckC
MGRLPDPDQPALRRVIAPFVEPRYAGFWRRLGAGVADLLLFLPVSYLLYRLDGLSRPAAVASAVLGQALYYAYVLPLTLRYGGTLGKLALGIRVRPVNGGRLLWRHVWRRSAVDFVASSVLVAGTLVGLSRVPFDAYSAATWSARFELLERAVPWFTLANNVWLAWIASEFVVMMLNRRRRALHDFIAGTVVVVAQRSTVGLAEAPSRHAAT